MKTYTLNFAAQAKPRAKALQRFISFSHALAAHLQAAQSPHTNQSLQKSCNFAHALQTLLKTSDN